MKIVLEDLIKMLRDTKLSHDKKGLEAEIAVGNILSKVLPDNTYIIAQPEIGELKPDFLIISPKYGFRIIEVKSWNIRYIEQVFTNGVLKTRYGNRNPIEQVKSHADELKNYLLSNFLSLGLGDPYRNIGYCVVHKGFSRREFENKFSAQLDRWSGKEKENYF